MQPSESTQEPKPADKKTVQYRTLLTFGVAGVIAVILVEVFYFSLIRQSNNAWQYYGLFIDNTVLGLVVLAGTLLLWRTKNISLTAWIFIGIVNLTFTAATIFVSGFGITLALGAVVFTTLFALQALSKRSVQVALVLSGMFSIIMLVLEYGLHFTERLPIKSQIQQGVIIVIGAVVLFYGIHLTSSQIEFKSLRTQLNVTYLITLVVHVLMIGIPAILSTQDILTQKSRQGLQDAARQASQQVESFLQSTLNNVQADASLPRLIGFLKGEETAEELQGTLLALGSAQREIKAYLVLDAHGKSLFDSSEEQGHVATDESNAPYYQNVILHQQAYASDVLFNPQTGAAELYFSAPISDKDGTLLGVLVVEFDAVVLQNLIVQDNITDIASYIILVDENHTILADGRSEGWLYKTTSPLSTTQVTALQNARRLPPGPQEKYLLNLPELETGLANRNSNFFSVKMETNDASPGNDQASLTRMQIKPWTVIAVEPGEVFLQPLYAQLGAGTALLVFLFAGAFLLANLSSRMLVAPVQSLTKTAERIQAGDLTARTDIQRSDELGTLANVLNQTVSQLSNTLKGLERSVAERTYDLEISRLQSEERARNLETISEVSKAISVEQRMDLLLPLIARTVSEKFGFYHTGIFLLDPTRTYAVLQAANSEGGQRMLARGHRLEVGQTGIVGYVADAGKPRIALDVGTDSAFFNNPDLPNTHSEMALPLVVRGEVIGVLDVQSEKYGAFTDNDANVLSTLADQVAIAIDNARLFERTQQALKEVQSMYSQYLRQEWKGFAQQSANIGYYQSINGGRLINKPVQNETMQQALERGEVVVIDGGAANHQPSIVMPVKLRGELLGVLNVMSLQKDRQWAKEEVALVQTASDRLALALENARLLQDSLRRAERERKVSEITSTIRSTNDPNEMIRLAVQELKSALGVNRIEVLPQSVSERPES
jgi:GAF domain-containing protein/HAMP domain-containing protein